VLFKPADAVCLPSLLEGLSIEEPLIETIPDEVLAAVGRDLRQWEHFYTVKSDLVSADMRRRQGGSTATPVPEHRQACFEVTNIVTLAAWVRTAD
jgi:hypothetical protein